MATSNNLGLYLPVREDYISVKRDLSDNYEVIDAAVGELDVIINGNTASVNVMSGQFVTVINSTITGITDGIYKATANVSAGTAFTSSNLQSVTSGALNDLNSQISTLNGNITTLSDQIVIQQVGAKQNVAVNDEITLSSTLASYSVLYVSVVKTDWTNSILNAVVIPDVLSNNTVTLTERSANDGMLLGLQKSGDSKIKISSFSASGGWTTTSCTLIIYGRK